MRKKYELEEKPLYNVVTLYRERGNYLQRLEQFEKAIQAYNVALRWNNVDVRSLLGRSLARSKSTRYIGALADAVQAAELEPENLTALQIRAQTEYEKCSFERSLVLAHRGQRVRKLPPDFAECARHAEETVRDCVGPMANKVLTKPGPRLLELKKESVDVYAPVKPVRNGRMQIQPTQQVEDMSRIEKQKADHLSRVLASQYLQRMAHDKYFLIALRNDERLVSANKQGSQKIQQLAEQALADIEKRQDVLRERRPLYAAKSAEMAARARLFGTRKEQLSRAQKQHIVDAKRLVKAVKALYEGHDTTKCIEHAEFAMEQISRKPPKLLPGKEHFLQSLHDIVANAFLDQKRVGQRMSESDREKRAFVLLGILLSREPSLDSMLRVRPPPPLDAKSRLRKLERALMLSARASERCYVLHELGRLHVDTRQGLKARFFVLKCQSEARAANQHIWLLNATFLLARCHMLQNNRPEARAVLIEGATLARFYKFLDVAEFFDTCVNVSTEGDVATMEATLEQREKEVVSLMQDDDLRAAAQHLFKGMSVIPASRRFSIMPGARVEDSEPVTGVNRRKSIIPQSQQPTTITHKTRHPLGFQDFDI